MPHLLMSTESPRTATWQSQVVRLDFRRRRNAPSGPPRSEPDLGPLRRQASAIIDAILAEHQAGRG